MAFCSISKEFSFSLPLLFLFFIFPGDISTSFLSLLHFERSQRYSTQNINYSSTRAAPRLVRLTKLCMIGGVLAQMDDQIRISHVVITSFSFFGFLFSSLSKAILVTAEFPVFRLMFLFYYQQCCSNYFAMLKYLFTILCKHQLTVLIAQNF